MRKKPTLTEKNLRSNATTQKRHQKSLITQRLLADLGRSVGVTTATQLVWLNQFTGPNLPINRQSCVIKRTHI